MVDALASKPQYRWVLLAAVWGVYAGFGMVAGSMGPVVGAVRADLGLSKSAMGLVLGAWQLVFLGSATPAGRLIERIGLRWSLTIAAAVVCVSGVARAAATNLPTLYAAVAIFGIGGPLISIGTPKLIADWFSGAERGTAVGIYSTAPSVGSMVALATANSVLVPATGSWRGAVAIYGLVAGLAGVLWWMVGARAAEAPGARPAGGKAGSAAGGGGRALLRLPVVRLVLALAVGSFLYSHAISNWLVAMLQERGRSPSLASNLAALTTLVGIAAAATVPRLAARGSRWLLLSGVYVMGTVGAAALPVLPGFAVVAALVLIGIARSAAVPVAMLTLMDDPGVGPERMAAAGGLYFTAGEIGGVAGPLMVGVVADATGGFTAAALVLAGVTAAMASATAIRGRRPAAPS